MENVKRIDLYNFLPCDTTIDALSYNFFDDNLKNCRIHNIAVTGPYGSGKTSILKSYFKQHKEYHPCFVSLANFNNNDIKHETVNKNSNKSTCLSDKNDELYNEIIKQIIFSANYKSISGSNYKYLFKKENQIYYIIFNVILSLILSIIFFAFITKISIIEPLLKDLLFEVRIDRIIQFSIMLVILIAFIILIYYIFSLLKIQEIVLNNNKLSIKLFNNESNTIDKNLSEILYIFIASGIKVVIFEDIDRFHDISIFTELRELNATVNRYINSNCKDAKPVCFIYSVRDEIFKNTNEKVKFFDAILPIIPRISGYNAFDKINGHLLEKGYKLSDEVINTISPYIEDLRILKSLINEFIVYYKHICEGDDGLKLNNDKLFYMVSYKVLFTNDFYDLYKRRATLNKFINKLNADNNEYLDLKTISNESINNKDNYDHYVKVFLQSNADIIDNMDNFDNAGINNDVLLENKNLRFVWDGIVEGYIDDTYSYYINYFYPGDLTIDDVNFISNVKDYNTRNEKRNYNLPIKNPDKVVARLHPNDFKKYTILNNILLDYLFANKDKIKIKNKFKNTFNAIIDDCTNANAFIYQYHNVTSILIELYNINLLANLLFAIKDHNNYSYIINNIFISFSLKEINSIIQQENSLYRNSVIIAYITNDKININNKKFDSNVFKNLISQYNIKINNLNNISLYNDVINFCHENNFYIINYNNFIYLSEKIYKIKCSNEKRLLFTNIYLMPKCYKYVISSTNNFILYINMWVKNKIHTEDNDKFENLILLLIKFYPSITKNVIELCDSKINNISNFTRYNDVIQNLLTSNKIVININNVMQLYNMYSNSPIYTKWLNDNKNEILKLENIDPSFNNFLKTIISK